MVGQVYGCLARWLAGYVAGGCVAVGLYRCEAGLL